MSQTLQKMNNQLKETPMRRRKTKPRKLFSNTDIKLKQAKAKSKAISPHQNTEDYINIIIQLSAKCKEIGYSQMLHPKNLMFREELEPRVSANLLFKAKSMFSLRTRSQTKSQPLFEGLEAKRKEKGERGRFHEEIVDDFRSYVKALEFAHRVDKKAKLLFARTKKQPAVKPVYITPLNTKSFESTDDLQREAEESYEWLRAEQILNMK